MGCLGKILKGCLISLLILITLIALIVLSIGRRFCGKLFGIEYTKNIDNISYSVTEYGAWNSRKNVSIPSKHFGKTVNRIAAGAFSDGKELTSISIPDSITKIEFGAFSGCFNLTSFTVDKNNSHYQAIDGNLYTKDGTVLVQYARGKDATHFTIPDGVIEIAGYAFSGCNSLTSVSIPDSVVKIGDYAFRSCDNISDIVIPDSVTAIGDYAFSYCSNLSDIVISDSITTIGSFAFSGCDNLRGIVIPTSLTTISRNSFAEKYVFNDNPARIEVYYKGSADEWAEIEVVDYIEGVDVSVDLYYYIDYAFTSGNYWRYGGNGTIVVYKDNYPYD